MARALETMSAIAPTGVIPRFAESGTPGYGVVPSNPMAWERLSRAARVYVSLVIVVGAAALVQFRPRTVPDPLLFVVLLLAACLTASWKVNLLIPLRSGSTLSVSIAAKLM